jgi:excisionase family DNA binding protein
MSAKATAHQYLSPAEVAELLGLSRQTIYRYLHSGSLPSLTLSPDGPLRIDSAELESWLKERGKT